MFQTMLELNDETVRRDGKVARDSTLWLRSRFVDTKSVVWILGTGSLRDGKTKSFFGGIYSQKIYESAMGEC